MFLRRAAREDPALVIRANGLIIRPPRADDYESWSRTRSDSRAFLEPWEPIWPADDLSRRAFRRRLWRYEDEILRYET